jgi:hypothetical protein
LGEIVAEQPRQATPTTDQAAATPARDTYRHALDQDYAISILMEMQRTLGKTEQSITDLKNSVSDATNKISRIEKIIYAAGVVLAIVVVTGGWLLNSAKDFLVLQYKYSLEQQARPSAPPPPPPAPRR